MSIPTRALSVITLAFALVAPLTAQDDANDVAATATIVGTGSSEQDPVPMLVSEAPVIGTEVKVALLEVPPSTAGFIYISANTGESFDLAPHGTVYLDLLTAVPYIAFHVDLDGQLILPVLLDMAPSWAGIEIMIQAIVFTDEDADGDGSGYALTNGLLWRFGS